MICSISYGYKIWRQYYTLAYSVRFQIKVTWSDCPKVRKKSVYRRLEFFCPNFPPKIWFQASQNQHQRPLTSNGTRLNRNNTTNTIIYQVLISINKQYVQTYVKSLDFKIQIITGSTPIRTDQNGSEMIYNELKWTKYWPKVTYL